MVSGREILPLSTLGSGWCRHAEASFLRPFPVSRDLGLMGLSSLTLSLGDWVSFGHFLYLGVHVSMYESCYISRQLRQTRACFSQQPLGYGALDDQLEVIMSRAMEVAPS